MLGMSDVAAGMHTARSLSIMSSLQGNGLREGQIVGLPIPPVAPNLGGNEQPKGDSGAQGSKRQSGKWSEEEETAFYTALRGLIDVKPELCMPVLASRIATKDTEQVTLYYKKAIKRINKFLGPQHSLDTSNHVSVHRAILKYYENFGLSQKVHAGKKRKADALGQKSGGNAQKKSGTTGTNLQVSSGLPITGGHPGSQGGKSGQTQASKDSSKGKYEGKVHFQLAPLTTALAQSMREAGYAEVLDLHISKSKSLFSVLHHLSTKWFRVVPGAKAGSILLHAPSGGAHGDRIWGGHEAHGRTEIGEIYDALERPAPCKLMYSWTNGAAPAPSAVSGQQYSKRAKVDPETLTVLRAAVNTVTGGGADRGRPTVSHATVAARAPAPPKMQQQQQQQQRPAAPKGHKTFLEMMQEDDSSDEEDAPSPPKPVAPAAVPAAPQTAPAAKPAARKIPFIRKELWSGTTAPVPKSMQQARPQQQQRQVQQPAKQAQQTNYANMVVPLTSQAAMYQTACAMPLPAGMFQYVQPEAQQQAALAAWSNQVQQQKQQQQKQRQPQQPAAAPRAGLTTMPPPPAVNLPTKKKAVPKAKSPSPPKAKPSAKAGKGSKASPSGGAKAKVAQPKGRGNTKAKPPRGKQSKQSKQQQHQQGTNSNHSWLAQDCPSPPSNFHLPDDFGRRSLSGLADVPEGKAASLGPNVLQKGADALFSELFNGDGAAGPTSSLLNNADQSKLSLGDLNFGTNSMGSLFGNAAEKDSTWMGAFDSAHPAASTAKSKLGDRPFAVLFAK